LIGKTASNIELSTNDSTKSKRNLRALQALQRWIAAQ